MRRRRFKALAAFAVGLSMFAGACNKSGGGGEGGGGNNGVKPSNTTIEILYNEDGGHKAYIEAIAQQMSDNLGIKVVPKPQPKFKDQLTKLKDPQFVGLGRSSWGFDYPTPLNLMEPVLKTGGGSNYSKWSNKEYDDLLTQAKAAPDDAKRKELVNKAEKVAMDEMPVLPFTARVQFRLYNNKFSNVKLDYFENPNLADIKASGGKTEFVLGVSEPTAIDPYNTQESEGGLVGKQLFKGLMKVNEDNSVAPDRAESVNKDDKCENWTIKLKDDKFSNGEAVTAESYVNGWNRVVDPEASSDVASFLEDIDGYEQVKTTKKLSGVSAADPKTLKVKLAAGKGDCEFDKRLVHPAFAPVPKAAGAWNNKTYNDMPIGNGPFKMAEPWQHDKSITLVPNENYVGTQPEIKKVNIVIEKVADEYKGYQAGQRDWARIPPELIQQARDKYKDTLIRQTTAGANYLTVSVNNKPLNNKDARKALSMAFDRKAIVDGVMQGNGEPADAFVPPIIKDYYQKGACDACKYDPKKALDLANSSGLRG